MNPIPEQSSNALLASMPPPEWDRIGSQLEFVDLPLCKCRITGLLIGPGAGIGLDTRERVLAMLKTGLAPFPRTV